MGNNGTQPGIADGYLFFLEPILLKLLRNQLILSDMKSLILGIAGNGDQFHPV